MTQGDKCPKGCPGYRLIERPNPRSTNGGKYLQCMRCGARFECEAVERVR